MKFLKTTVLKYQLQQLIGYYLRDQMLRRGQTVRTTVALLEHMKKESRNSDISMLLLAARMRLNLSSCCNARLGRESPVDHLPYNLLEEVSRRLSFELYKDLLRRQFAMLKMEPGERDSRWLAATVLRAGDGVEYAQPMSI